MLLSKFLSFGLASEHFRKSWAMDYSRGQAALLENLNEEETTIIVGAGSLGLSTAYYLGLAVKASGKPRKIVVLEVFNQTFAASSGQNTGCLHHLFYESEGPILEPLGKYSFNLWDELAQDAESRRKSGYRAQNCFEMSKGHGLGLDVLPEWFEYDPRWDVKQETLDVPCAMVNPIGVGKWLTAECTNLGVEIWLNATVNSVALSSAGVITSVEIISNGIISSLSCTSLVLAAGPWTPEL